LQERVVDTAMDVLMFAREIAPCLRIQKNKEFDAIEHLVPETTFRYLKERFS